VLCDRNGRSLAVIEAKRSATNPADAAGQARAYAEQLGVPIIFLANGEEVRYWDWQVDAHPRTVKTIFSPHDLERRYATRVVRKDPRTVAIDRRIVERDYLELTRFRGHLTVGDYFAAKRDDDLDIVDIDDFDIDVTRTRRDEHGQVFGTAAARYTQRRLLDPGFHQGIRA
jgi:hypothetical protein